MKQSESSHNRSDFYRRSRPPLILSFYLSFEVGGTYCSSLLDKAAVLQTFLKWIFFAYSQVFLADIR